MLRASKVEDVRKDGRVYLERSIKTQLLKRDGLPNMQKEVLSGKYGTEQGDNYLAHEMVRTTLHKT